MDIYLYSTRRKEQPVWPYLTAVAPDTLETTVYLGLYLTELPAWPWANTTALIYGTVFLSGELLNSNFAFCFLMV